MAVPEQKADLKKLVRMLEEGNRTCGPESEILSNTIYHYDRESNTMTMAASYFSEEELAEADQLFSGEQ